MGGSKNPDLPPAPTHPIHHRLNIYIFIIGAGGLAKAGLTTTGIVDTIPDKKETHEKENTTSLHCCVGVQNPGQIFSGPGQPDPVPGGGIKIRQPALYRQHGMGAAAPSMV